MLDFREIILYAEDDSLEFGNPPLSFLNTNPRHNVLSNRNTEAIITRLKTTEHQVILVLNKVDLVNKPGLLALAEDLNETGIFTEIFMISAKTGDGFEGLMSNLEDRMPKGPWLFPEDQISDLPGRLLAAEITREKLYLQLHQELPYAAAVETEGWKLKEDGSIKIDQIIYIERKSQKAIVLGRGGKRIKAIGEAARKELEDLLEARIHLFLFVKVHARWGDDPDRYRDLGLEFNA